MDTKSLSLDETDAQDLSRDHYASCNDTSATPDGGYIKIGSKIFFGDLTKKFSKPCFFQANLVSIKVLRKLLNTAKLMLNGKSQFIYGLFIFRYITFFLIFLALWVIGEKQMRVGTVKEVKPREYRVALTSSCVKAYTDRDHKVMVEKGAGENAGFADSEYAQAGAVVTADKQKIFDEEKILMVFQTMSTLTHMG